VLLLAACAPSRTITPVPAPLPVPVVVAKAPVPEPNPKLPPVPDVRGPLQVKVQYPSAMQLLTARDSNFIHGQIGNGDAGLTINGVLTPVWPNGSFLGWLPVPTPTPATDSAGRPIMLGVYDIVAVTGTDTARLTHTVRLPMPPVVPPVPVEPVPIVAMPQPTFATLGPLKAPVPLKGTQSARCFGALSSCVLAPPILSDTDRVVVGRPSPTGTYKWFLFPGTSVHVTATQGDFAQVQLDAGQTIWISRSDMDLASAASASAPLRIDLPRIVPAAEWVDIVVPTSVRPTYLVEESARSVTLTFYGVSTGTTSTASASYGARVSSTDPFVASLQQTRGGDRATLTVDLASAPFGYLALYENGSFILRLRRPPTVDAVSPLKGLTIAVDPGHPPVGATGPTGLWEPQATLPVGFKLRDMLLEKGANVVLTRTAHEDVDLAVRPTVSRRNNAHAFVSIHYNALPDGVNPFTNHGTNTYYFYQHSQALAGHVQRNLVSEMGLRDKGVHFGNFAVIRGTWMPSVLAEGAFIMIPDQEAAMRTSQYQDQYARGIVQGLEDYFRTFTPQK
jgi:N-acetylmuramoyl-L-alanine amidase